MAFELVKGDIDAVELGDGQWTCRVSFMAGKKYIVIFEVCFEVDGVENVA